MKTIMTIIAVLALLSGCMSAPGKVGPRRQQILADCRLAAAQARAAASGAEQRIDRLTAGPDVFVACLDARGY